MYTCIKTYTCKWSQNSLWEATPLLIIFFVIMVVINISLKADLLHVYNHKKWQMTKKVTEAFQPTHRSIVQYLPLLQLKQSVEYPI